MISDNLFRDKKVDKNKLYKYGFEWKQDVFRKKFLLLENQFELTVIIDSFGKVDTTLIDLSSNEPYTLHLLEGMDGAFVSQVRDQYLSVLQDILENCYSPNVFKWEYTLEVIDYCKSKYNTDAEYLWEKFPNNAVLRRKDNSKWYAAILTVAKNKLGLIGNEIAEVIDIRCSDVAGIVDNKKYFPGYHMNKKNWLTIVLDGSVPLEDIKNKIDESYVLAKKK